jgi:hypothetical protein
MKRYIQLFGVILLFVLSTGNLSAQNSNIINGSTVDSTNASIEFVNIGIVGKNIGTVSDDSGSFILNIPNIPNENLNDTLTFSRIGYYTKSLRINDLLNQKNAKIILLQKITQLEKIQIISKAVKSKKQGNITRAKGVVMVINSASPGHENGTLIHLPKNKVFIKDFNFHIDFNRPDSAKFRLNIYSFNNKPVSNILNENIYFTVTNKDSGDYKIDLSKYRLYLNNDIFVSIESIALFATEPDLNKINDQYYYDRISISGTITGSKSFYRSVSFGNWQKIKSPFSPGFWITYLE